MKIASRAFFLFLTLLHGTVSAQNAPTDGFYFDPDFVGMGWNVENQDGIIAVTHYVYDDEGRATFFTSAGVLSGGSVISDLFAYSNGPCIDCSPTAADSQNLGQVRIDFIDNEKAILTYPGGSQFNIQRLFFGYGPEPHHRLPGTWMIGKGDLGLYFGDFLEVTGLCGDPCDNNPTRYRGQRLDGGASRILIVGPEDDDPTSMAMLVDSSTSYYNFYLFEITGDLWGGRTWTYLKDEQPTGSGLVFFGSRLQGPNAPDFKLGASSSSESVEDLNARARAASLSAGSSSAESVVLPSGKAFTAPQIHKIARSLASDLDNLR